MEFPLFESLAGVFAIAYLVLFFTAKPFGSALYDLFKLIYGKN